jgi:hypothetical protein
MKYVNAFAPLFFIILFIIFVIKTPSLVNENVKSKKELDSLTICLAGGDLAEKVMDGRQNGVSKNVFLSYDDIKMKELQVVYDRIVDLAFDYPVYLTEAEKRMAIIDFKDIVIRTCLAAWSVD